MAFSDSNGTGHSFPIDGYETAGSQGYWGTCIPGNFYPANSYSGDATGFNLNLSTVDGSGAKITDKHGTQYTLGPGGGTGSVGATVQSLQPNQGQGAAWIYPTSLSYQQVTKVEDNVPCRLKFGGGNPAQNSGTESFRSQHLSSNLFRCR